MMNKRQSLKTAITGLAAGWLALRAGGASHAATDRFPGDPPEHKLVYQLNHADPDYIDHILNSLRAMIIKYDDNVALAVVAFGPGIHVLATRPERPVADGVRERLAGMARDYKVELVACGNTMTALNWGPERIIPEAKIEAVGAAALMDFQEKGYAYIAW
jgi:uncharacterized protein